MIRTAYIRRVEARLRALIDEINKLKLRASQEESPDIRAIYREQIKVLEQRLEAVHSSLRKVNESLQGKWGHAKDAADQSIAELKKAIETAIEKLRKSA